MDFSVKINELIKQREWKEALEIVDALDLSLTKDVEFLSSCAKVYKKNHRLTESNTLLSSAFSLESNNYYIALAFAQGSIEVLDMENAKLAVDKLMEIKPNEYESLMLKYELFKITKIDINKSIEILEELKDIEYDEEYGYELAEAYWKIGDADSCKSECRRLINYFRNGEMVQKAKDLLTDVMEGKTYTEVKPISIVDKKIDPPKDKDLSKHKFKDIFNFKKDENNNKKTDEIDKKAVKPKEVVEEIKLPAEIEEEFKGLIGMDSVKREILKFINIISLDEKRGLSANHNKAILKGITLC